MARIVDYASLQTAIAEWLWRDGDAKIAARADAFIDLFEREFMRDQRLLQMQEVFTTPVTGAEVTLPLGFLELIRIQIVGEPDGVPNQVLTYVPPEVAATMDATQISPGVARYYTLLANDIFITPQNCAPIGSTIEVSSYCFNQLYIVPKGINWLISTHPDVYLYGSLLQASAYIDDDRLIARWQAGMDRAMASIQAADLRKKVSGSPLVVRPSMSFISRSSCRRWLT